MRRQAGWSLAEVSIAGAIGVLILGGSIALSQTASDSTTIISKQAALRRAGEGFLAELKHQLSQSGIERIDVVELTDSTSAVAYQCVVDHIDGRPVWGASRERVGTPIDPNKLLLEGLTVATTAVPTDNILEDWKCEFRVATLPKGDRALVKLYRSPLGVVVFADVLTRGVREFEASKYGETLEVWMRLGLAGESATMDADAETEAFEAEMVIVPRN